MSTETDQTSTTETPGAEHDEATVAEICAAETAAQRSLCVLPDGDLPKALADALERRVEVNLAQHRGGEVRRVGSSDAQVRELEAPYRRRRSPEKPEAPKNRGSRRRRTTKNTSKKGSS